VVTLFEGKMETVFCHIHSKIPDLDSYHFFPLVIKERNAVCDFKVVAVGNLPAYQEYTNQHFLREFKNNSESVFKPINTHKCTGITSFVCFQPHEQFFSYLAAVTITGDRAANLDLCLALTAFSK
jgi:hypothetical protein